MSETNVQRYSIRCANDPTTYHWQSGEATIAGVIREFEHNKGGQRIAFINGSSRDRYITD